MVLRHLNVSVVCTMDDHKQEVIGYCRENNFHGLIADDAEYAAFDPQMCIRDRYCCLYHLFDNG